MSETPGSGRTGRAATTRPALVIAAVGVPLLLTILLVWTALSRPEPPTFTPGPPPDPADIHAGRAVIVTVDARHPGAWRFLRMDDGRIHESAPDRWDLAFRRFSIIANGGAGFAGNAAIAPAGEVAFDDVTRPPTSAFEVTHARPDSVNPAISRWYSYGFTSHLLTPLPHVWVVRTTEGRYAALEILGYYCPGPTPGCVTVRYRFLDS